MGSIPPVEITEMVQQAVDAIGSPAERWLAEVDHHIAIISEAWDLVLTGQLHRDGMCSIIMTAKACDGRPAILKLSIPHDDASGEADALGHWNRNGAVGLIRSTSDGFTLLLERCQPGTNLWNISLEQQIKVVSDLLPRLWLPAHECNGIRELSDTVAGWEMEMNNHPASFDAPTEVVGRAARWARELLDSQPRVLLHGDLNPGNVLNDQGNTWVAIDPKPWVGDPAFDLAQLLQNWLDVHDGSVDEKAQAIAGYADQLAGQMSLSVERILRWSVIKALGWKSGYRTTVVLDTAARLR